MFTDGSIFESGGTLFKKRVIRDFNDVRKKKKKRERDSGTNLVSRINFNSK